MSSAIYAYVGRGGDSFAAGRSYSSSWKGRDPKYWWYQNPPYSITYPEDAGS